MASMWWSNCLKAKEFHGGRCAVPLWVGMTIASRDVSNKRKLGIFGRKIVKDLRGESRKGPRPSFAPTSATRLLNYTDGLVVWNKDVY